MILEDEDVAMASGPGTEVDVFVGAALEGYGEAGVGVGCT